MKKVSLIISSLVFVLFSFFSCSSDTSLIDNDFSNEVIEQRTEATVCSGDILITGLPPFGYILMSGQQYTNGVHHFLGFPLNTSINASLQGAGTGSHNVYIAWCIGNAVGSANFAGNGDNTNILVTDCTPTGNCSF